MGPRFVRTSLAAVGIGLALVGLSCGKLSGTLSPRNAPPETIVFVSGPLDSTNHVAHLYWYGTDSDGFVVDYQTRLLNPEQPLDTGWVRTSRTDSVFTVYSPNGFVATTLEVRAWDDRGAVDPEAARQVFSFTNQPPVVRITQRPGVRDSTFASVTVSWNATDVDGDPSKMRFLVWLDGHASDPQLTTATTFTMPSSEFRVAGQYSSGPRTLYVRGIDDGGMAGPIDSMIWQVKRPVTGSRARLLIVDDVPRTNAANNLIDSLYTNSAWRALESDTSFTVLRLDFNQPFASIKDVEQTCKLFETVVWYRGNMTSVSVPLRDYHEGIGPYLESGGRFYLDGLYLFSGQNAPGALTESFARRYLGCDRLLKCFAFAANFTDSTLGWGNVNNSVFRSTMFADSSRQQQLAVQSGEAGGFRVFKVTDPSYVAMVAPPGVLTPARPESLAVGLSVPQPRLGRAIILSVPLGTSMPPNGSTAARLLGKIFAQLGLTVP